MGAAGREKAVCKTWSYTASAQPMTEVPGNGIRYEKGSRGADCKQTSQGILLSMTERTSIND